MFASFLHRNPPPPCCPTRRICGLHRCLNGNAPRIAPDTWRPEPPRLRTCRQISDCVDSVFDLRVEQSAGGESATNAGKDVDIGDTFARFSHSGVGDLERVFHRLELAGCPCAYGGDIRACQKRLSNLPTSHVRVVVTVQRACLLAAPTGVCSWVVQEKALSFCYSVQKKIDERHLWHFGCSLRVDTRRLTLRSESGYRLLTWWN